MLFLLFSAVLFTYYCERICVYLVTALYDKGFIIVYFNNCVLYLTCLEVCSEFPANSTYFCPRIILRKVEKRTNILNTFSPLR